MTRRLERTVRVVMWVDAFFSVAAVVAALVAVPLVAALGVPAGLRPAVGVLAFGWAVLLGLCGPVYAGALMVRMRHGEVLLPARLWLPLPGPLRPAAYARTARRRKPGRDVSSAAGRPAGGRAGR